MKTRTLWMTAALPLCFMPVAAHAQLNFTLDQDDITGQPNTPVVFSGTLTNTGSTPLYLNGDSPNADSPLLTIDGGAFNTTQLLTPFTTDVPAMLAPAGQSGSSYSGALFDALTDPFAAPGDYTGSFDVLGGADANAQDDLGSQNFTLTVPTAPAQDHVTDYSDRSAFSAAVGPTSVEDFGTGFDTFPSGVLNSQTNVPGLTLKPGVTYSTPVDSNAGLYELNLDLAGGFAGADLDGEENDAVARPLTVTFDTPVTAFGFDTNQGMGTAFTATLDFADGTQLTQPFNLAPYQNGGPTVQTQFFGFQSDQGIVSAVIAGNGRFNGTGFAVDNVTFGGAAAPTPPAAVPEPPSLALLGLGLLGMIGLRRKRTG